MKYQIDLNVNNAKGVTVDGYTVAVFERLADANLYVRLLVAHGADRTARANHTISFSVTPVPIFFQRQAN